MDDARIKLLQGMPIFGGIKAETLEFLLPLCPTVSVAKDDFFFRENDDGGSMFVLETGTAAVEKSWQTQSDALQTHRLQTLTAGDCFGEMAVMDMGARSASVRALEDCTAICISAGDLYKIYGHDLKQFALIQMNMGREVCRRLRAADDELFRVKMGATDADL